MKFNKTLAAALLLTFTLTGCNNVVDNKATEGESPVVEENTADDAGTEATEGEDATETTETTEDEETVETTEIDPKEADSEDDTETDAEEDETDSEEGSERAKTDTSNMSVEEKKEVLETAIFENRSRARAAELLLEMTPEKVEDIAPQLHELIDESNALLEKAQLALEQLDAQ